MNQMVYVVLHYEADTVKMYSASDNELLETMAYTVKGDSLNWRKINGGNPCNTQTVGTYQFVIKNDEMAMQLIK